MVNVNRLIQGGKKLFDEGVDIVGDYVEDLEFKKFLEDKKIASKNKKAQRAKERSKIKKSQKESLSSLTDEKKKELGIITASEIPYLTLDDGVQAMTKKQAKDEQLRQVRKKRYNRDRDWETR